MRSIYYATNSSSLVWEAKGCVMFFIKNACNYQMCMFCCWKEKPTAMRYAKCGMNDDEYCVAIYLRPRIDIYEDV